MAPHWMSTEGRIGAHPVVLWQARSMGAVMHSGFGALRGHFAINIEVSRSASDAILLRDWDDLRAYCQLQPMCRRYISGLCPSGIFAHGSSA